MKDGFDHGEKAIHIEKREEYLKRFAEAGINVREVMETGRLEVLPATRALGWWDIIWIGYFSTNLP